LFGHWLLAIPAVVRVRVEGWYWFVALDVGGRERKADSVGRIWAEGMK
jgi:hypothetical protein